MLLLGICDLLNGLGVLASGPKAFVTVGKVLSVINVILAITVSTYAEAFLSRNPRFQQGKIFASAGQAKGGPLDKGLGAVNSHTLLLGGCSLLIGLKGLASGL